MRPRICLLYLLLLSPYALAQELPRGHPQVEARKPDRNAPAPVLALRGTVLNTIDVSQYTYIEVMQQQKSMWLATTTTAVKKGDVIRFEDGVVMTNFYSNALKRSFPEISFVGTVVVGDAKD